MANMFHTKTDNIDSYMKDIEQYPRLTLQDEVELYEIIHGPDPAAAVAARDKLICSNLRIVVKIAHDFKRYDMSFKDIISEGNLGLCIAADKFNPSKGAKFSAYASWWVKQTIRRSLTTKTRTVCLPSGAAQLAAKVAKTRNAIIAATGMEPTDDELAKATGLSKQRLEGARIADIKVVSSCTPINEDSATTFEDMLSQEDDYDSKAVSAKSAAVEKLLDAMKELSDLDKFILEKTYGIGCKPVLIDVLMSETGWCARCIHGRLHQIKQKLKDLIGADALEV